VDTISKKRRSWNMSRIRSKNTRPELLVRSILHRAGLRFRIHSKNLPGHPDIVLSQFKTVIFVNGCFWHRHANCKFAYMPKSRVSFWKNKFRENIERDRLRVDALRKLGWHVHLLWECETRDLAGLRKSMESLFRSRAEPNAGVRRGEKQSL
jgi:DNA mismatch endonuclease, patch repair protein